MIDNFYPYLRNRVNVNADPRVADFFLMNYPLTGLSICCLYLYTVLKLGPKYMEHRKPYNLKEVMFFYNIFSVVSSAYIFYECLKVGWQTKYSYFKCNSLDTSLSSNAIREIQIFHLYFLCKFVEFLDTIFFVLRKKNSQITFLHVYHHTSMPIFMWAAIKFYPGGSMTIVPFFNSFIHVIMYAYYLLAGLGPEMRKYLWWKKYLTVLQLLQFILGVVHFLIMLFDTNDCNIPKYVSTISVGSGTFFYLLFSTFYKTAYQEKTIPKDLKDENENISHKNAITVDAKRK